MDVTTTTRPPRHAHLADLPALAERDMLTLYAAHLDVPPLAPKAVRVEGGQCLQIDGVSLDEDLFVIPISHQGMMPDDANAHLARDVFSLSLVTSSRPGARAVLLFASSAALESARGMIGGLGRDSGITLDLVDLGQEWTERLVEAHRPAGRHRAVTEEAQTRRRPV
ncbi:hypothetical protein KEM60_01392 [Austwickia sp. TVS 96-490-7B]|uniref:hypothetical protein n=1 Tax=Austwickia sp. TVS 96-490-7B TaxID=2830843 RepID=UPI001C564680|nr:hypothetical protein [Austwickia sp. TVS 96-490-7B]MBW3085195.1 hypothetical protein [Austwickia sp. TVS 96-490-7B]